MSELKPCPFCGAYGYHAHNETFGWLVICRKCGARTQYYGSKAAASRMWNRRAEDGY